MTNSSTLLEQAHVLHQSGQLAQAETLYRQILQDQPQHFDALHRLGLIALQNHQPQTACDLFRQALTLQANSAEAHYNLALAYTTNQQTELALKAYRQAVRFDPDYINAHYNRANLLRQLGRLQDAVASYRRVLELDPDHLQALYNCGVTLQDLGQLSAALECFNHALRLEPNLAPAYFQRGLIFQQRGQTTEATASFAHAQTLQPSYAQELAILASQQEALNAQLTQAYNLHQNGQLPPAEALYRQILQRQPHNFDALHLLGVLALQTKHPTAAGDLLRHALMVRPQDASALYHLGLAHAALHQYPSAITCYQQALAVPHPDPALVHNSLGIAQHESGQIQSALDSFTTAIRLKPDSAQAHNNRGNILIMFGQFEAALACFEQAIRLDPHYAGAHVGRGIALQRLHRFDEVQACYDAAIALDANYADAYWQKGLAWLARGDFKQGWHYYGYRLQLSDWKTRALVTDKPSWQVQQSAEAQTTLLWSTQGLGDDLMFSMLLNEFNKQCAKLIVKVDARIIPLLHRSLPSTIRLVAKESKVDESLYDTHLPLENIAQYLRPNAESFKTTRAGYLKDDKARTKAIRKDLKSMAAKKKKLCGISWRSTNKQWGLMRSLELSEFIRLIQLPDYEYVSLQYSATAEEIAQAQQVTGIEVLQCASVNNRNDIDGLASLIKACDVVVSVDNSTVHLAGGLGQDVRVLLPFAADWRWQIERGDSLWYPSAKLYRQDASQRWAPVFERLKADL